MLRKYKKRIYKQELYQGRLFNKNNYFEGWYFKNVTKDNKSTISFIVGVSYSKKDNHSFIQILDNIKNKSYYLKFEINDFEYSDEPFYIKIKNNYFSFNEINIDISNPIKLKAILKYNELTKIDKSIYSPNIMGPFAYLTFLECYHSIISIKHRITGYIDIYDNCISFEDGVGYIEKDYGISFPKQYLWIQSNSNKDSSIFLAIASIPLKKIKFKGFISILEIGGQQYRFSTYNFGKIKRLKINNNKYLIIIVQGNKTLEIIVESFNSMDLISPKNGEMKNHVKESLESIVYVKLFIKKKLIYNRVFNVAATELFNY